MNDLDDRLIDLLTRSAAAVEVRPDLDAVIDDDVVVPLDQHRRPRRVAFALVAAAVLLVAAIAAVALANAGGDDTEGVTDGGNGPAERFPVLDVLPDDLTGVVAASGGPMGDAILEGPTFLGGGGPVIRAVIGRVADDGTVSEATTFEAVPELLKADSLIPGAESTRISGLDGHTFVDEDTGTTAAIILGDGASVIVHGPGATPENLAGIEGLSITTDDGRPVLDLGDLPAGLDVLLPPGTSEIDEGVEVGAGTPGEPEVKVSTVVDDPIAVMAQASDTFAPVDIGGADGWIVELDEGGAMVAWRGPGGVALLAQGRLSPEDTLLVARGVRLVDAETWLDTYGNDPEGIPIDEATAGDTPASEGTSLPDHPLLGQAAPEIPAVGADEREGRAQLVTFVDDDGCPDCIAAVREVAAVVGDDSELFAIALDVVIDGDDDIQISDDLLSAARGLDVLSTPELDQGLLDAWSITDLPTTVVVDPEGTVAQVLTWPVDRAVIAGAVQRARVQAATEVALGWPAPELAGALTHVGSFTPPQDRGEWTIVTITRVDCEPCADQLDVVAEYVEEHPDGPGLPVSLVVDEGEDFAERVDAYAEAHGVDWPVLVINEDQEQEWGAVGGAVVVLDPQGIVQIYVGGFDDADELADLLEDVGAE